MAWFYLVLVGLASTLKLTQGFTKPLPTLIFLACAVASFLLLARAARDVPIGTAYLLWTGIGAGGTALLGIFLYQEPATAMRLFFIVTLIGSIIGLKITTPT